jgi:hypothetical protein
MSLEHPRVKISRDVPNYSGHLSSIGKQRQQQRNRCWISRAETTIIEMPLSYITTENIVVSQRSSEVVSRPSRIGLHKWGDAGVPEQIDHAANHVLGRDGRLTHHLIVFGCHLQTTYNKW